MSDHAPGPWRVIEEYGEPYSALSVVAENGYHIARFWLDEAPVLDLNSRQIANAKLVASAPGMKRELGLLREVIVAMETLAYPVTQDEVRMQNLILVYRKEFPEVKGEDDAKI